MRKLPQKTQENKETQENNWARTTAIATCVIAFATVLLVILAILVRL